MKKYVSLPIISTILWLLACIGSAGASPAVFSDTWDPADDVVVDSNNPYYFMMMLPGWDLGREAYTAATLDLTYYDQNNLAIMIFAIDPVTETDPTSSIGVLLGTVPWSGSVTSGTARFDLLLLHESVFNALFTDQGLLYLVADCSYVFDKATLTLEANPIPVPPALVLLGSGLIGLAWLRTRPRR